MTADPEEVTMDHRISRLAIVIVLTLVVATSGWTLMAGPGFTRPAPDARHDLPRLQPVDSFNPCPWPPCMAPCKFGVPPEGLCKSPDGAVTATTFFCCCCGSGSNGWKSF